MEFKHGDVPVRVFGCTTYIVLAIAVADTVWRELGASGVVVTSMNDGKHMKNSLHYAGNAVDLRIWNLLPGFDGNFDSDRFVEMAEKAANILRSRLTAEYRVVVERTHIHVQYSPGGD